MSQAALTSGRWALLGACAGPAVWLAGFALLYGMHAIACMTALGEAPALGVNVVLAAVLTATVGLLGVMVVRSRHREGFLGRLAWHLNVASLAATVWTGFPLLFLTSCI